MSTIHDQQTSRPSTALVTALLDYAESIDDPSVLLPSLMVSIEANLYAPPVSNTGNWADWRPFEVKAKMEESRASTSFHLYPIDGGPVADYRPGQYLTVRVFMSHLNLIQTSPYVITSAPNGLYYCISVHRKAAKDAGSSRKISSRLCDAVQVGDRLDLLAPASICTLTSPVEMSLFSASRSDYPMLQIA